MIPSPRYPDETLLVPAVYGGTVELYAKMALYGSVALDKNAPWDKRRKESHRTTIGGANGPQRLTVPIVKPEHYHGATIGDIRVSDHGRWWELHWGALESAYGRTPYFEYYADELRSAFTGRIDALYDLDLMIHRFACRVIGLNDVSDCDLDDCSKIVRLADCQETVEQLPYWQVWDTRFGFQPNLSVLDLIFSEGPATPLHLMSIIQG